MAFTHELARLLIDEVVKREGRLFGDAGGSGRGADDVEQAWGEIVEVLASRGLTISRDQASKKYSNIKQETKKKLKKIQNPPTGGGKPPKLTPPEQYYLDTHRTASEVIGIIGYDVTAGGLVSTMPVPASATTITATEPDLLQVVFEGSTPAQDIPTEFYAQLPSDDAQTSTAVVQNITSSSSVQPSTAVSASASLQPGQLLPLGNQVLPPGTQVFTLTCEGTQGGSNQCIVQQSSQTTRKRRANKAVSIPKPSANRVAVKDMGPYARAETIQDEVDELYLKNLKLDVQLKELDIEIKKQQLDHLQKRKSASRVAAET